MPVKLTVQAMDSTWHKSNIRCQCTCPVHTNAGGYVSLIAQGRYDEAAALAAEPNPLVWVCGHICAHPCETACRRGQIDEPVAIRALKRFAVEQGYHTGLSLNRKSPARRAAKVAVIGAGPAGLAAAHDLAVLGYHVTIFEAQQVAGGMLYCGIPAYRLPRTIIQAEIQRILELGVELKTGSAAGRDFTLAALGQEGYQAIFIAVGASKSRDLKIPGHDLDGVLKGVDFLLNINLGYRVELGQKVVVIGGGNVAIDVARSAIRLEHDASQDLTSAVDAARSALRLGAKEVHLVCLESQEEMPADRDEIAAALQEGIVFHPASGPLRINGQQGKVNSLVTQDVAAVFDTQGRFNPSFIPDSERTLPADTVILAIGQRSELDFLQPQDGIAISPGGTIVVDPQTMTTSAPGIFAGGDVAFGPRIAINAIADGRQAARSIHAYLQTSMVEDSSDQADTTTTAAKIRRAPGDDYLQIPRQVMPTLEIERRIGVTGVELGFDATTAQQEARRCLQCFLNPAVDAEACILCGGCVDVCPYNCLQLVAFERLKMEPDLTKQVAHKLGVSPDAVVATLTGAGLGVEATAMLKDEERCVRCGLCEERCPVGAVRLKQYVWWEAV